MRFTEWLHVSPVEPIVFSIGGERTPDEAMDLISSALQNSYHCWCAQLTSIGTYGISPLSVAEVLAYCLENGAHWGIHHHKKTLLHDWDIDHWEFVVTSGDKSRRLTILVRSELAEPLIK